MKNRALILGLILPLQLWSARPPDTYGCAMINGQGKVERLFDFTVIRNGSVPVKLEFYHRYFFKDLMIHKKVDNSFVGDSVAGKHAYDISPDDQEYFVIDSNIESTLMGEAPLVRSSTQSVFGDRYETVLRTGVRYAFVTNAYAKKQTLRQDIYRYKISFEENPISYIINIDEYVDEGGPYRRTYPCSKK